MNVKSAIGLFLLLGGLLPGITIYYKINEVISILPYGLDLSDIRDGITYLEGYETTGQ